MEPQDAHIPEQRGHQTQSSNIPLTCEENQTQQSE